jgi:hypothetical protein
MRHALDLDLYREKSGLDDAEAALRAAAALEVDFVRARRGQTGSSLQQSAG